MGGDLMAREWDVPGYTEVKTLGSGGFGDVVLARHDASGATRAAVDAVITVRAEQQRNGANATRQRRGSRPV
jgi:hypothetical protein